MEREKERKRERELHTREREREERREFEEKKKRFGKKSVTPKKVAQKVVEKETTQQTQKHKHERETT